MAEVGYPTELLATEALEASRTPRLWPQCLVAFGADGETLLLKLGVVAEGLGEVNLERAQSVSSQ